MKCVISDTQTPSLLASASAQVINLVFIQALRLKTGNSHTYNHAKHAPRCENLKYP